MSAEVMELTRREMAILAELKRLLRELDQLRERYAGLPSDEA